MSEPGHPSDRRRHPRERRRLNVRFGAGDMAHVGHTQDVSEGGIYLKAQVTFPTGTILVLQLERTEGMENRRGIVRWSKEAPPAFRRSLRCGMGIEFLPEARSDTLPPGESPAARAAPPRPSRSTRPPEVDERELGGGPRQRRQVSTRAGNTYEVLLTEYRGAWYLRIFQLPRTDGSAEALFRGAFWSRDEADRAVRAFLRDH